ncbi:MAG TPA: hypothetical protein VG276_10900 [Actinomycetes bacterium]|nr:hypothetical protein [Actinomycetes bacterium]
MSATTLLGAPVTHRRRGRARRAVGELGTCALWVLGWRSSQRPERCALWVLGWRSSQRPERSG